MLVDSHCHLDRLDSSLHDVNTAIKAAEDVGVKHFLCVCIDLDNFPAILKIAEDHANVFASVGVHPTETAKTESLLEDLVRLAAHPKVVALGETGLDYYRDCDKVKQQDHFRQHIRAAKQVNKPLIVHTRQAREDTIKLLSEEGADQVGGVFHCFTEDLAMAEKALALNFYISFSGIVTFKNATDLQKLATQLPLDRILVETDSPYLAPTPFRGKPNQPAYVRYVAEYIANLRGLSLEKFAAETTANFFALFEKHQKRG